MWGQAWYGHAEHFWKYLRYDITNDAFIDQYVSPVNIRVSGYIKEVRFREHQYVHKGDTLLVLDNSEYYIRVKEAEAALLDAQGTSDVLAAGMESSPRGATSMYRMPTSRKPRPSSGSTSRI